MGRACCRLPLYPEGIAGGGEDGSVGFSVGVLVVVGEVAAGVEEPPFSISLHEVVRGVKEVGGDAFAGLIARNPRGAGGAVPRDAVVGVAWLDVDGLGIEAVAAEKSEATLVGVGNGQVVELLVDGVVGVGCDDAFPVSPSESVGTGVAIDDAHVAFEVVLRGVAWIVFFYLHEGDGVHLEGAVGKLVDVGGIVREKGSGGEFFSGDGVGFLLGASCEAGFAGYGSADGSVARVVEAGGERIYNSEASCGFVDAIGGDVADDSSAVGPEVKAGAPALQAKGDDLDGVGALGHSSDGQLGIGIWLSGGAHGVDGFPFSADGSFVVADVFDFALGDGGAGPDAPAIVGEGFDGGGEILDPSVFVFSSVAELFAVKGPGFGGSDLF